MAVRAVVDPVAVQALLTTDPTMQKALGVVTEAIRNDAQERAPYGVSLSWPKRKPGEPWVRRPMRHGRYKAAFEVRKVTGGWELWNLDPFAHLVEWGSIKNPAYAPIRQAIVASGLRFSRGKGGKGRGL